MFAYELWDFDPEISEIIPVRLNTYNSHSSIYGEVSHQPFSDHSLYVNDSLCMSCWDFPLGLAQYQSDSGMKSGLEECSSKDLHSWTCVPCLALWIEVMTCDDIINWRQPMQGHETEDRAHRGDRQEEESGEGHLGSRRQLKDAIGNNSHGNTVLKTVTSSTSPWRSC